MVEDTNFSRCCSSFLSWAQKCYWLIILAAVVVSAGSIFYTVSDLTIRTSKKDLISSNLRLIKLTDKMDKDFGGHDGLAVVVENVKKSRSIAFAKALAALTTTAGFGSLMVSGDRGTFSLGLLATIGSLSVLLASLSIVPAFLSLMGKRLKPGSKRFYSLLGSPEVPEKQAKPEEK